MMPLCSTRGPVEHKNSPVCAHSCCNRHLSLSSMQRPLPLCLVMAPPCFFGERLVTRCTQSWGAVSLGVLPSLGQGRGAVTQAESQALVGGALSWCWGYFIPGAVLHREGGLAPPQVPGALCPPSLGPAGSSSQPHALYKVPAWDRMVVSSPAKFICRNPHPNVSVRGGGDSGG